MCEDFSPIRAMYSPTTQKMIMTFWHEPKEVHDGTVEISWMPNRTGSKKRLNQDYWREAEEKRSGMVGKNFRIAWNDTDSYNCEVLCYYPRVNKYKVFFLSFCNIN